MTQKIALPDAFLQVFDNGNKVIDEQGYFTDAVLNLVNEDDKFDVHEKIKYSGLDIIEDNIVGNGDCYVEREMVVEVNGRYFVVGYDGIGKDLDEYINFRMLEAIALKVVKTVYLPKN